MKKVLIVVAVFAIFAVSGVVLAANSGQKAVGQQQQTQNQGTNQQLQTQNSTGTASGTPSSTTNKGNKPNATGTNATSTGNSTSTARRSAVANAVQEMLRVAERNGGIGQQVRVIAQAQNQNQEKIEKSLEDIQSRSFLKKLLIGPDTKKIEEARKLIEENKAKLQNLIELKNQLLNSGDQKTLEEQIQLVQKANEELMNVLQLENKGSGMFGWMFRLFSK